MRTLWSGGDGERQVRRGWCWIPARRESCCRVRAAERVGLVRVTDGTVRGIGDNAKLTGGYRAIAERFRIGDVEYRDAVISVADQSFVGIEDGLIGSNVLGEFLITLDFAGGKLRLRSAAGFSPGR